VSKLIGALLLIVAAVAGAIGVAWVLLDAIGKEWDYCPEGRNCIAGWKMGTSFLVGAVIAGVVGFVVLRGQWHGSRSGGTCLRGTVSDTCLTPRRWT
jgi:hypothetical protein